MQTIHLREKSGEDGMLHVDLPVGVPGAECAVTVAIGQRFSAPTEWLPGFWEDMAESWQGEPLVRPPQGEHQQRDELH